MDDIGEIAGDDGYLHVETATLPVEQNDEDFDASYLVHAYMAQVQEGTIESDVYQITALQELDRLRQQILQQRQRPQDGATSTNTTTRQEANKSSFWNQWFGGNDGGSSHRSDQNSSSMLRGVYLHGGVGSGKTFCMNLFYDSLVDQKVDIQKVHFHSFMLQQVHNELFQARQQQQAQQRDDNAIWSHVVSSIVQQGSILCLDEFQVTDVADALLLQRLFTQLWNQGVVLIATSNRPPQDLYLGGLQRELFLPFIDALEERTQVVSMWESEVDYRVVQGQRDGGPAPDLFLLGEGTAKAQFRRFFQRATAGYGEVGPVDLPVSLDNSQRDDDDDDVSSSSSPVGRIISLKRASVKAGVALFTFRELCHEPRGAADYLCLGRVFHTIFVQNVPRGLSVQNPQEVNVVRRLITLVDALYESHVRLVLHSPSACTTPREIVADVDLSNQHVDEAFAFDRTQSRLDEMLSHSWIQRKWKGRHLQQQERHKEEGVVAQLQEV